MHCLVFRKHWGRGLGSAVSSSEAGLGGREGRLCAAAAQHARTVGRVVGSEGCGVARGVTADQASFLDSAAFLAFFAAVFIMTTPTKAMTSVTPATSNTAGSATA